MVMLTMVTPQVAVCVLQNRMSEERVNSLLEF